MTAREVLSFQPDDEDRFMYVGWWIGWIVLGLAVMLAAVSGDRFAFWSTLALVILYPFGRAAAVMFNRAVRGE